MVAYCIAQVTKYYPGQDQPANDDISLDINQGEMFGILGDNGAGKTTLIRQMVNLLKISSGEISLFGVKVDDKSEYIPMNVGYMPQDTSPLNKLTVGEALYFTAHLRGMSRTDSKLERDRLLELWRIEDLRNKNSSDLSGGQRRLLRLSVAMAGAPPVLILDEPTNDLDPQRRKLVWDILRKTNKIDNTTIIFVTHDAIEAEKAVDRVAIMQDGKILVCGEPSQLKREVYGKLRLELFFAPNNPPKVPDTFKISELQPGRWMVYLDWEDAAHILNTLDKHLLHDIHLYSATLEDLYLHYVTQIS